MSNRAKLVGLVVIILLALLVTGWQMQRASDDVQPPAGATVLDKTVVVDPAQSAGTVPETPTKRGD